MQLIVTGRGGSGKSVAVERIVRTALQASWASVLIVDGKTGKLMQATGGAKLRVTNGAEPARVAELLREAADRIDARKGEARTAGPELIVIDDIYAYTRVPTYGTRIRTAIARIYERATPADLVVVSTQRSTGSVPPAARDNATAELRLLGSGHYLIVAGGGAPPRQGRIDPAAPLAADAPTSVEAIHAALVAADLPKAPTLITRYEGPPGSGRTFALDRHAGHAPGLRRVYVDARAVTHKELVAACLTQCGAAPPEGTRVTLGELSESAAIALRAAPTLLLIDNADCVTLRMLDTIHQLIDAAAEAAIGITPPRSPERDPLAPLRRRAALVELRPLERTTAQALVRQVAPAIDEASAQAVVERAAGSPQAVVAFAERVAAHGDDERHNLEAARPPARWLNLLIMFAALVVVLIIQRSVAHDLAGAVLSAVIIVTMWFIRPRFARATRPT